jgi:NTP pyrophosphatase (non-canonical NTP hydrolase)
MTPPRHGGGDLDPTRQAQEHPMNTSGWLMLQRLADQFEAASLGYVAAHGLDRDADWFVLKMQEELGELTQVWNKLTGRGRRRDQTQDELRNDLADEAADLLGHILLFVRRNELDLAGAVERKWRFKPEGE